MSILPTDEGKSSKCDLTQMLMPVLEAAVDVGSFRDLCTTFNGQHCQRG